MKKTKLILYVMIIIALYYLSHNMSSMEYEQGFIDGELSFNFSMADIETFNSFESGKDISIKVGLTYEGEIHDVKIKNASKDNTLVFIMKTNKDLKIFDRQAYELIFMENNSESNYKKLSEVLDTQDINTSKSYKVKIFINDIDYGVFLMKQCDDDSSINENKSPSLQENTNTEKGTNSLESFKIGDTKAKIDHDNKVIFINLEKGADTLQKISYKFSNYPSDIFIESPNDHEGFESTKVEDNKEYDFESFIYRGKLSYVDCGNRDIYDLYITTGDVQLIEISTDNEIGEVVKIDISDKIPCNIWVLSNMNEDYNNKIIKGRIEISGKTLSDKKNYSIQMDKKYKFQGMGEASNWILDGCALDITLMRKKLTYDILTQIYESDDVNISIPEVRYAEVILNGQYQGLYTLSNKIDADFLNLDDFQCFEQYNDLLYKSVNENGKFTSENMDRGIYNKDYEDFPEELQPKSKSLDPIYGWHSGYEQKWPDIDDYGQHWESLETLIKTIALSSEEEFENIFSLVEREKFINLWAVMLLQNNLNGTDTGQYIIRDGVGVGKWFFIPWEVNPVFGIDKDIHKVEYNSLTSDFLFDRCMKIESFNRDFVDKWSNFVTERIITVENYYNLIDSYFEEIEDSQKRNYERWSIYGEENFYDEVEYIKSWIKGRINWLDIYFDGEELNEK